MLFFKEIYSTLKSIKNYNYFKIKYDICQFQSFVKIFEDCNLALEANIKFLDFGCGDGRFVKLINDYYKNFKVTGLDVDNECVKHCKKKFKGDFFEIKNKPPLLFDLSSYDIIFSYSVFTHLTEANCRNWFIELSKKLTDNGVFLFTFASINRLYTMRKFSNSKIELDYNINNLDEFKKKYNGFYFFMNNSKLPEYGNTLMEIDFIKQLLPNNIKILKHFPQYIQSFPFGSHDVCVLKKIS